MYDNDISILLEDSGENMGSGGGIDFVRPEDDPYGMIPLPPVPGENGLAFDDSPIPQTVLEGPPVVTVEPIDVGKAIDGMQTGVLILVGLGAFLLLSRRRR